MGVIEVKVSVVKKLKWYIECILKEGKYGLFEEIIFRLCIEK